MLLKFVYDLLSKSHLFVRLSEAVLKALGSLESTEEKLAALCKKYADLLEDNRILQQKFKQGQKSLAVVSFSPSNRMPSQIYAWGGSYIVLMINAIFQERLFLKSVKILRKLLKFNINHVVVLI